VTSIDVNDSSYVVIDWTTPYNGGTPITSYVIQIRKSDSSTFSIDSVDCDGSDATILAEEACTIPISTLRASPYLLPWGGGVYARVIAVNVLGSSLTSTTANGAIILTLPDAPVDLLNNEAQTSGTQISLTWMEGDSNGGTAFLDYTVTSASDGVTFVERQVGIVGTSVTLTGFTLGVTYAFKVKARTAFGFSADSASVTVLAAQTPEEPEAPVTSIDELNVVINWTAPNDNGSVIIGYKIYIR
jgi:hypothetical protein